VLYRAFWSLRPHLSLTKTSGKPFSLTKRVKIRHFPPFWPLRRPILTKTGIVSASKTGGLLVFSPTGPLSLTLPSTQSVGGLTRVQATALAQPLAPLFLARGQKHRAKRPSPVSGAPFFPLLYRQKTGHRRGEGCFWRFPVFHTTMASVSCRTSGPEVTSVRARQFWHR